MTDTQQRKHYEPRNYTENKQVKTPLTLETRKKDKRYKVDRLTMTNRIECWNTRIHRRGKIASSLVIRSNRLKGEGNSTAVKLTNSLSYPEYPCEYASS
ncbi:hypothetical protein CHS0354_004061 [Potamilus streckersoni]|uniref:Uncharacterized protein n=1 Tax=Potamilus streckersoni TaxID=2493646 RepID=A0AAE0T8X7_9BIVA|nr:hypothetical protein CHS0354_004061 [Potamilus streckersoni]